MMAASRRSRSCRNCCRIPSIFVMRGIVASEAFALFVDSLSCKYNTAGLGQWVHRLAQRARRNKVIVAIANKLARIAWAVLSSAILQ